MDCTPNLKKKKTTSSCCAQISTGTNNPESVFSEDRKDTLKSQLNLTQGDLTPEEFRKLEDLLLSNNDVFALNEFELGRTSLVSHKVDTGEHSPIKHQPRRTFFVYREKVAKLVDEMLQQGVIKPSS